jgi:hypothetical protein
MEELIPSIQQWLVISKGWAEGVYRSQLGHQMLLRSFDHRFSASQLRDTISSYMQPANCGNHTVSNTNRDNHTTRANRRFKHVRAPAKSLKSTTLSQLVAQQSYSCLLKYVRSFSCCDHY